MNIFKMLVVLFGSYLIGSIVTSDIVTYFKKVDLRNQGSGNIGATNAFRVLGPVYGSIVLIGDALKGVLAVLLSNWLNPFFQFDLAIVAGIFAIIGHNWPLFAKFHGGKGIATSLGVVLALTPWSSSVSLAIWILIFVALGYVSLASILAAFSYPIAVYLFYPHDWIKIVFALIIAFLAIYRHKANIQRLWRGQEHRILYQNKRGVKDR